MSWWDMLLALLLAAAPDLEGVPSISTRFTLGHACPISATMALTAAHVVDPAPFNFKASLMPVLWNDRHGHIGTAVSLGIIKEGDLAVLRGTFPHVFPRATEDPEVGSYVYISAYGTRFAPKVVRAKVLRRAGGMLIYDRDAAGGSSGSCVLNEAGEVVGINVWGIRDEDVGLGVSIVKLTLKEVE